MVFAVFAIAGYFLARWIPRPKTTSARVLNVIGLILLIMAGYVGVSTNLVSVMGFKVTLSEVLQGLLLGILIRFAVERR